MPGNLAAALALDEAGKRATASTSATRMDGASGQAFSRGTLVSLMGVLFEPGFAVQRRPAGATRPPGAGVWRFEAAAARGAGSPSAARST